MAAHFATEDAQAVFILLHRRFTLRWVRHDSAAQTVCLDIVHDIYEFTLLLTVTVGRGDLTPPFVASCIHLDTAGWGHPALQDKFCSRLNPQVLSITMC